MAKSYLHITPSLRSQIFRLRSMKFSYRATAKELGIHHSTVSREIRRNSDANGYDPLRAQKIAEARRHLASVRPKTFTGEVREWVLKYLKQDFSPVQISGRLKRLEVANISHEAIYRMIWKDKRNGGDLYKHLRHSGKKYNKRGAKNAGRGCIPGRVDIDERPKIVEDKVRIGDWEIDLVVGTQVKGFVLLTMVDRASKFVVIRRLRDKTADGAAKAIIEALQGLPVHTITSDNGKEFAKHADVSKALKTLCFFAKPYHSWERGLNEHTNGLIRQYLPKKQSFEGLSLKTVQLIEERLNNRPRKVLDFMTPKEIFLTSQSIHYGALAG